MTKTRSQPTYWNEIFKALFGDSSVLKYKANLLDVVLKPFDLKYTSFTCTSVRTSSPLITPINIPISFGSPRQLTQKLKMSVKKSEESGDRFDIFFWGIQGGALFGFACALLLAQIPGITDLIKIRYGLVCGGIVGAVFPKTFSKFLAALTFFLR
jgi:hypothetical protein